MNQIFIKLSFESFCQTVEHWKGKGESITLEKREGTDVVKSIAVVLVCRLKAIPLHIISL